MIENNFVLLKTVTLNKLKNSFVFKNWSCVITFNTLWLHLADKHFWSDYFWKGVCVILGVFTALRKATISFVMFVRLSISLSVSSSTVRVLLKFYILI